MSNGSINRRSFLFGASVAGFGVFARGGTAGRAASAPNERLNFACIGVGGKGSQRHRPRRRARRDRRPLRHRREAARREGREVPRTRRRTATSASCSRSWRPKIDAVVVSTPDHTHAAAAVMAMRLGKPVYCQKPLAHSPYEARLMRETARRAEGRAPRWATRGRPHPGFRRGIELIRSGVDRRRSARSTSGPTGRSSTGSRPPTSSPGPSEMPGPAARRTGTSSSARPPSGRTTRSTTRTTGAAGGTSAPARWATWPATPPTSPSWR